MIEWDKVIYGSTALAFLIKGIYFWYKWCYSLLYKIHYLKLGIGYYTLNLVILIIIKLTIIHSSCFFALTVYYYFFGLLLFACCFFIYFNFWRHFWAFEKVCADIFLALKLKLVNYSLLLYFFWLSSITYLSYFAIAWPYSPIA